MANLAGLGTFCSRQEEVIPASQAGEYLGLLYSRKRANDGFGQIQAWFGAADVKFCSSRFGSSGRGCAQNSSLPCSAVCATHEDRSRASATRRVPDLPGVVAHFLEDEISGEPHFRALCNINIALPRPSARTLLW